MAIDGQRNCPRCGAVFVCGSEAGSDHCWCADLPNIVPLDGIAFPGEERVYDGCLCPDCLHIQIAALQEQRDL